MKNGFSGGWWRDPGETSGSALRLTRLQILTVCRADQYHQSSITLKLLCHGALLVALRLRVCPPAQRTWVLSWSWKIPRAVGRPSLGTTAMEPALWGPGGTSAEAWVPGTRAPPQEKQPAPHSWGSPRSPKLEKAHTRQRRPTQGNRGPRTATGAHTPQRRPTQGNRGPRTATGAHAPQRRPTHSNGGPVKPFINKSYRKKKC